LISAFLYGKSSVKSNEIHKAQLREVSVTDHSHVQDPVGPISAEGLADHFTWVRPLTPVKPKVKVLEFLAIPIRCICTEFLVVFNM